MSFLTSPNGKSLLSEWTFFSSPFGLRTEGVFVSGPTGGTGDWTFLSSLLPIHFLDLKTLTEPALQCEPICHSLI